MAKLPKKRPRGNVSGAGREYAKAKGWSKTGNSGKVRGLTDSDVGDLIEVEQDNTEQIIHAIDQAKARALEKIGLVAEGYAKKLCPVDTGRLRNSITHSVDVGFGAVYIGTNVEYAQYVEDRQPYLHPAARDHAATYRAILESEMKSGGGA